MAWMAVVADWAPQEEQDKESKKRQQKLTCAVVDTPCSRPLFDEQILNVNAASEIFINHLSKATRKKKEPSM